MNLYNFDEFKHLDKKGRTQFLKESGRYLQQQSNEWSYSRGDDTGNIHHIEKKFQDGNGDDVEVTFKCRTGSAYLGESIGYELETDPDDYNADDELDTLMDIFKEIEEDLTDVADYKDFLN